MRIPRTTAPTAPATLLVAVMTLLLTACGGGGADDAPEIRATGLYQFGYITGSGRYVYGYDSIARIALIDAPDDTDTARIAMAHGDNQYWLFALRQDSDRDLYVFRFNGRGYAYQNATSLTGAPDDADGRSLAALHYGQRFSIYLRSRNAPERIYQFDADNVADPFRLGGGGAISVLNTTGAPADADFSRWTMFHDGTTYRQAVFVHGSNTTLYQFGWNGGSYNFGTNSRDIITIEDAPEDALGGNAAILHDGARYRLYRAAP